MRLKHLTVAGFRGFAHKQEFDLSADATIVVGVNGLGKTSFFDAILWSLSGKLPRVGEDNRIVSLYSTTGEANVSLVLVDASGSEVSIRRNSDGSSQTVTVKSNGREFKGASATSFLADLLWPEASSSSESDTILNSTLCRSVYLQQDCIREFLDATTDQERFNTISQLIGTGPLTDFQLQLEKQRTSWTKATNQLQKDGDEIQARVDALQRQLEKLQKSSVSSVNTVDSSPTWADWWALAQAQGVSSRQIPAVDSLDATSALDEALREIGTLRDSVARKKALLNELSGLLNREPPLPNEPIKTLQDLVLATNTAMEAVTGQLDAARKTAADLRKLRVQAQELNEQKRALAQLAIKLLSDKCPVCDQDYDRDSTYTRLNALISAQGDLNTESPKTDEEVSALIARQAEFQLAAETAKQTLRSAELLAANHREWSESRERRLAELSLTGKSKEELDEALARTNLDCDQKDAALISLRKSGEGLALRMGQEIAKSRITSVTTEYQAAATECDAHRAMIKVREATGRLATQLLEELREAGSKVALDKLTAIEPFLQRIYARIDPHPAFRVVKFATKLVRGRGRLDTEVHDREEGRSSDSPAAVLSSSQMNALAVSIFLTFNLSLPRLPIEAALLDDPIQSLDDINLLGVIDLLRRTKDKRQLIVSTHDERFGRLLARKLRPINDKMRTSVIELSSWTRTGPEARQYSIEMEPVQLRLIKAG